jgi:hypothetical protein
MRTILVSYDLHRPEQNQASVAEAIMSLGSSWARPLANVWYLRGEVAPVEIERRLAGLLDEHDGLVVQEARGEVQLCNTGLRWFRQRKPADVSVDNVVALPLSRGVERGQPADLEAFRAAG